MTLPPPALPPTRALFFLVLVLEVSTGLAKSLALLTVEFTRCAALLPASPGALLVAALGLGMRAGEERGPLVRGTGVAKRLMLGASNIARDVGLRVSVVVVVVVAASWAV